MVVLCYHSVEVFKYSTVQYSTVQYSTVQYSTVQYFKYSTVLYSSTGCTAILYSAAWSIVQNTGVIMIILRSTKCRSITGFFFTRFLTPRDFLIKTLRELESETFSETDWSRLRRSDFRDKRPICNANIVYKKSAGINGALDGFTFNLASVIISSLELRVEDDAENNSNLWIFILFC